MFRHELIAGAMSDGLQQLWSYIDTPVERDGVSLKIQPAARTLRLEGLAS